MTRAGFALLLSALVGSILGMVPSASPGSSGRSLSGVVVASHSGAPVQNAQVEILGTRLGSRTNIEGHFMILDLPTDLERAEIEITHPCFHTIRVQLIEIDAAEPLLVGAPIRWSMLEHDPNRAFSCSAYGA